MQNKFKQLLILGFTVLLLGWLWHYFAKYRPWDIRIPTLKNQAYVPDYEFSGIRLKEVSGPSIFYDLQARELTLDKQKGLFKQITGNVLNNNNPVLFFAAVSGELNFRAGTALLLNFTGHTLRDARQPGKKIWFIRGQDALWDQNNKSITVEKNPVLSNGEITINSTKFKYYVPFQYFLIGPECTIKSGAYQVSSQKAILKDKIDTISLEDKVSYESKEFQGKSDQLDIFYADKSYAFKQNVFFEYQDSAVQADLVTFNSTEDTVSLRGNVKFAYEDVNVYSDRALLKRKDNIIEFYENSKGWQGKSIVQSNQLVFDFNKKTFVSSGGGRTKLIKNND